MTRLGSLAFFSAEDAGFGRELWRTDGTPAGTFRVSDVESGPGRLERARLRAVGSTLFFVASSPTLGQELWKSDGTVAGTVLVKDIAPGSGSSVPHELTALGATLMLPRQRRHERRRALEVGRQRGRNDAGQGHLRRTHRLQRRPSSPPSARPCSSPPRTAPTATSSGSRTARWPGRRWSRTSLRARPTPSRTT